MSATANNNNNNGFHIVLPSKVKDANHVENTHAMYRTRLARPLVMEGGEWEVALVEFQYSNTWDNVTHGEINVKKRELNGVESEFTMQIGKGRYSNIAEIVERALSVLDSFDLNERVSLVYNRIANELSLIIRDSSLQIGFSKDLAYIFGLVSKEWYAKGTNKNDTPPDITSGLSTLYIYSDLVDSRLVGNTLAPLLRTVSVTGERFENVRVEFTIPHYIPVANARTQVVEVNIMTSDGRPVPFQGGGVLATLHARKSQR
jgi:hypothetical protein